MRTLGFACKPLDDGEDPVKDGKIVANGLTFMGIASISDPIRPDVADAVKDVNNAGINVKIVTDRHAYYSPGNRPSDRHLDRHRQRRGNHHRSGVRSS